MAERLLEYAGGRGVRRRHSGVTHEQALEAVAASSSTWLRADLAREVAALLPAEATGSATEAVRLVDLLAEAAAARCVELHTAAPNGAPCRRDGRPLREHVSDRRLSAPAVLDQEARLLAWARSAVGSVPPAGEDPQAAAAQAVSGDQQLALVVGPAGAGKTTMLGAAAARLRSRRQPAIGLAPSGKAADVLATETGWPATTLAKLLHEHAKPEGPRRRGDCQQCQGWPSASASTSATSAAWSPNGGSPT